ncbi:MAG: DNA polymerase III subunit delta' [Marinilabiliaceae bacterium]|nr:DNA polymerase III subunit delta' [Marinilabiliaceae bacterium]
MFFKEVIGQLSVKSHLLKSVKENRLSHAYLLAGNEGTGALPLAIAFASYLNCLNPKEDDSCGTCSSCLKARKLIHPDIHFVFPVIKTGTSTPTSDDSIFEWRKFVLSNPYFTSLQWFSEIGDDKKSGSIYVEESISIIKKLSLKNFEGKFKIMIIWLPERMNVSGANKLLKILEEPPANTVFLLVSENPDALLLTILSRTQRIKVPPIETKIIADILSERFSVPADEAAFLAKLSAGNFVKAIENLNNADNNSELMDTFANFMRHAYGRKVSDLEKWVSMVSTLSRDKLKNFFVYATSILRDSFLYNYSKPELVFLNKKETEFVNKFSRYINSENVVKMVEELDLAYAHIEQNGNAKIVLFDMAIKFVILFNKK